jgi:O-acetyl-ADP-ribose deacetylase (regulator of RNase III)
MKYINGDILTRNEDESREVIVCHQVNCMGVMGAGLAKQIRDKFPGVYQNYKEKCELIKIGFGGLGDVQFNICGDYNYIIANVFGQYHYGRGKQYTDYDALHKAFSKIHDGFRNATIRIPYRMGCGLGGGDWDVVLGIISDTLAGMDVEIWHYIKE